METTTVELSHKWMLYTQMALAALPHFPHSNRGLPHVLVPALVHVPKFPMLTRSSKLPPGARNGHLELQTTTWSSKRPPGAPNGHPELKAATGSSKRPPGAPNGHPELHTDTNNRRFLVQTKHILSEYNQIIDYTEILAMGFERGVIRIEHPQLGGYMFCNQMTSNWWSR